MKQTSFVSGFLSSVTLLSLYVVTMTLLSGWEATVEQFQAVWWLMVPLAVGFGIQVGLYVQLNLLQTRYHLTVHDSKTNGSLGAGGTSSTLSMLACCAHHATDVLPFLGLSGLSLLLSAYQVPLLVVSLAINAMGIFVMIKHIKKATV